MPRRNDLLLGQIALEKKLITQEQLQQALAEQAKEARPRPLSVLLVARGLITDYQIVHLIDEHRRRLGESANYADARNEDILFEQALIREGRATAEKVNEALRRQQELAEEGTIRRLGEILVEQGTLSIEVVQQTLKQQGKTLVACPSCGARFNVVGYLGGKTYQCKKCGMNLEVATTGAGADETAFNLPAVEEDLTNSGDVSIDDPKKRFGKYVLVRQVGTGGFGTVYKAYEKGLGRIVAVKFLHSEDPEDLQRFTREAQTAAKLTHPHIVPLHEVGEHTGKRYIAMEFIEGDTLKKLRIESDQALRIMRDVAGAVEYAHSKGIIHRDLKPQNLMMGADGHVWVMDFGLARHLRGGTTLTMSGAVVGTPSYMPPEQAEGLRCDARSDVYSLGATLYDLLTAHPPFEGTDALAILDRVRSQDPAPPRKYNPKIHREVETIVLKCLEKDPKKRYPSAMAFAEDLRRHMEGEPIIGRPAGRLYRLSRRLARNRAAFAFGVVAALALLVLVGAWTYRRIAVAAELGGILPQARGAYERGELETARRFYERVVAIDPSDSEAKGRLADCESRQRRIDRLMGGVSTQSAELQLATWNEIVSLNPLKASYLRERGISAMRLRRYDDAARDLKAALALDPLEVHACIQLWYYHANVRRDPAAAERVLAESIRRDPESWPLWLQRAIQHQQKGEYQGALDAIERVIEAAPAFTAARLLRGVYRLRLGDVNGAREDLEGALQIDPRLAGAHAGLSEVYAEMGRLDLAEREARLAVELDPADWTARDSLGSILLDLKRLDDAEREYALAVRLAPHAAQPIAHLGLVLLVRGRIEEAFAAAEKALAIDPTEPQALHVRGTVRRARGDVLGAESDLRASLARRPDEPGVLMELGNLLSDAQRTEEALHCLDRAAQRRPWSFEVWENRARARYVAGKFEEAEADYREAARLNAIGASAHYGVGLCRMRAGDLPGAEEAFGRSIERGYVAAHYNRGIVRMDQGKLREALEDFQTTVEKDESPARRDGAAKAIPAIKRQLGLSD